MTLTVTAAPPPAPTVTITASPASITAGSSSTLTVTATNATGVTVSGTDGSTYTLQATGGTQSVSPTATTTYTATATGAGGKATATAAVTVTADAPGADGQYHRQSHFDHRRQFFHPHSGCDQRHAVTISGTDGSTYTLKANWRHPGRQPGGDHHVHGNRDRSGRQGHSHRDRDGDTGRTTGADRHHHRQPRFDHFRQFFHLDRGRDLFQRGYDDRLGWQQLYPEGQRRNPGRQPDGDYHVHGNRNRNGRQDLRQRDGHRTR